MTILIIYSAFGVSILIATLIIVFLEKRKRNALVTSVFDALSVERTLSKKIQEEVIGPSLGGLLVIFGWPFFLAYSAYRAFFKRETSRKETAREFAVSDEHLVEKLTIEDIEQRERVEDPLLAVPELAFGHLNAAWTDFLERLQPECEIWSFEATWTTPESRTQQVAGYVSVNDGQLGNEFVTLRNDLAHKAKPEEAG